MRGAIPRGGLRSPRYSAATRAPPTSSPAAPAPPRAPRFPRPSAQRTFAPAHPVDVIAEAGDGEEDQLFELTEILSSAHGDFLQNRKRCVKGTPRERMAGARAPGAATGIVGMFSTINADDRLDSSHPFTE